MEASPHPWPALGVLLLRDGIVSKEDLESVLGEQHDSRRQRITGGRLGELLVERGMVTREQVAKLVAEQYELPYIDLDGDEIDLRVARLLTEDLARQFMALPISELPGGSLLVAIADPATVLFAEDLRRALEVPLRFAVVPPNAMNAALERVYAGFVPGQEPEELVDEQVVVDLHPESPELVVETPVDGAFLGSSPTVTQLWPPLGALLVRDGLVTDEELDAALAQQRLSGGKRLGEILFERGSVTRADVARLVAEQYELPFVDLVWSELDPEAAALLPEEVARRYSALPIDFDGAGALRVAISDPAAVLYSDELRATLGVPLTFAVASPDAIDVAIDRTHPRPESSDESEAPLVETAWPTSLNPIVDVAEAAPEDAPEVTDEDQPADEWEAGGHGELDGPVVALAVVEPADADAPEVDEAIERALELGATDIHFTPQPEQTVVRIRVDGALRELETFPSSRQAAISARLRALGQLDDGTTHAPQGRIVFEHGEGATGLRIVLLPTAHGNKATLHVLKEFSLPTSLDELGMSNGIEETLRTAIAQPSGLVLVCGPEGSGCSTTLYAALRELNTAEKALATIEDPVEQMVPGVDQVEVDDEAGLTYDAGLRAILLSDPDVVFVGELTDSAAANGAMRAAVSGRLVLSRLHVTTPGAASDRLVELGVDRGAVSATLSCVVGQRLLRRICPDCREPYYPTAEELAELGRPSEEVGRRLLARGGGCVACGGTGLRGRIAIFEVLSVTDEIRDLIASGVSSVEVERVAVSEGMPRFRDEAIRLCLEGETTVSELRSLVQNGVEPAASWDPDSDLTGADEATWQA
jgi:type IV pilus assembly protein PilB